MRWASNTVAPSGVAVHADSAHSPPAISSAGDAANSTYPWVFVAIPRIPRMAVPPRGCRMKTDACRHALCCSASCDRAGTMKVSDTTPLLFAAPSFPLLFVGVGT